jgi:hypothetical protein
MNPVDIARRNQVEARKIAYRQTKDGIAITFQIHPNDAHDDLRDAPLGQRYLLVPLRLSDDEQPESGQSIPDPASLVRSDGQAHEGAPKPKRHWHQLLPSQRAGILCHDAAFQQWANVESEEEAAEWLRKRCCVFSRAHLDKDDDSRRKFERIEEDFQIAVGRVPPPR